MRKIKNKLEIQVRGYSVNNLRYANNTALIAKNERCLQKLTDKVVKENEKKRQENRKNDYVMKEPT